MDRRGVLLLPQTEPDPSFVRAQSAFCVVGAKKNASFFQGNFFFGGGEEEEEEREECLCSLEGQKKRNTKRAFGEV